MKMLGLTLSNIATGAAIISSIATPFIWGGAIQSVNAVQDVKLSEHERRITTIESKIDDQNDMLRALLMKNGIDPKTVISQR